MNICLCGTQAGYPHYPDCPYPLFRATEAQEAAWMTIYDALKAKQEATRRILDARAAAGLLDADEAAATMTAARQDIAQSAEAMQTAHDIQFADQHEDWLDWQWSIGDLSL